MSLIVVIISAPVALSVLISFLASAFAVAIMFRSAEFSPSAVFACSSARCSCCLFRALPPRAVFMPVSMPVPMVVFRLVVVS